MAGWNSTLRYRTTRAQYVYIHTYTYIYIHKSIFSFFSKETKAIALLCACVLTRHAAHACRRWHGQVTWIFENLWSGHNRHIPKNRQFENKVHGSTPRKEKRTTASCNGPLCIVFCPHRCMNH